MTFKRTHYLTLQQVAFSRLSALPISVAGASLIYSLAAVAFCRALLWILYRKRIFLKI